ncbi:hypothetical protein [Hydrogenophaga electricum]|uniref:Uncharacterized protein n=1 Tax=Hydrogenophaga electricum TaxID=1230953 RepID=A0ABQ6C068_9BURK|nr:hypothetical protein [Hydrogenophaga electricum]GLS13636.1 hypothetical protein GCM10007935_10660 [Hydrogenophaga electricum]
MAEHTMGRIARFTVYALPELRDQQGQTVAVVGSGGAIDWANARRLEACWNACDGISTENLENNLPIKELALRYNAALKQRGELLRALQLVAAKLGSRPYGTGSYLPKPIRDQVFAAIAMATKQEGVAHG